MSFLASLSHDQLQRLRRVVKQVHMRHYPKDFFTDREADRIIESLGPEVMEKQLKAAVDRKLA
jgi:hypothetical protein